MIALVVTLQVHPGQRDRFLAAIADDARATVEDEPGCVQFDVLAHTDDDHRFTLHEVYTDQAALRAHRVSPHFLRWRAVAAEVVVPGSQVSTVTERLIHHT